MSRLCRNSMFVEREKGCRWADKFRSQVEVEHNNGVVSGAPTFSLTDGVTMDGTNDYLTYNLCGHEFDSAGITILIRFTPDFAVVEAVHRYLYYSDSADAYWFMKRSDGRLNIGLGGTSIALIAVATFTAYWNVDSENIVVISATATDTDCWINGNRILTNDTTAWSQKSTKNLFVGANEAGLSKFDGTIHDLKVFQAKLTDQECLDLSNGLELHYNGAVQDFVDDGIVNLLHDYRQQVATDSSGNSNDGTVTDTHYTGRGLGFPATTSVNTVADAAELQQVTGSVVILLDVIAQTADKRLVSKVDAGGTNYELYTSATGLVFHDGTNARTRAVLLDSGINCIGVTFESGEKCEAFVKGVSVGLFNDTSTITVNDAPLLIGNHYGDSKQIESTLLAVLIFSRVLTAAEMAQVYADLRY